MQNEWREERKERVERVKKTRNRAKAVFEVLKAVEELSREELKQEVSRNKGEGDMCWNEEKRYWMRKEVKKKVKGTRLQD